MKRTFYPSNSGKQDQAIILLRNSSNLLKWTHTITISRQDLVKDGRIKHWMILNLVLKFPKNNNS